MKRRSFLKKLVGGLLTLVGLGSGTYYYARQIEPTMLTVRNDHIVSANIPEVFNNFKIVQFSDTHIGFQYTLDQFGRLVEKINSLEPDLIVFTGDLVDKPNIYDWNENIIDLLKALSAQHGKFWVYGNHDHGGYGTTIVNKTMEKAGFVLLKNTHSAIEIADERIYLAGVDDVILGKPDLETAISGIDPAHFTILLAHEPDYADVARRFSVDVQLSGHSHGGQVRLPLLGHLYTPAYAQKYVEGRYTFPDEQMMLYVSRGIGTTRLPFRFLCKPEIQIFTLKTD